jgi:hypothetical protein
MAKVKIKYAVKNFNQILMIAQSSEIVVFEECGN